MVWLRWLAVSAAALGCTALGCTTNHDSLARRPATGGASGSGGTGGTGFTTGNTGNVPSGGRVNLDDEPAGADVLTIVNGVVDAKSVRLCFARLADDAQASDLLGEPLPELAYGGSTVLTELSGLDPAVDAIQPWVLAGDFSLLEGLDCQASVALALQEEAKVTPASSDGQGGAPPVDDASAAGAAGADDASGGANGAGAGGESAAGAGGAPEDPGPVLEPPTLRARPIATLPPGSLTIGRSLLMVLSGCLGGAYYRDAIATSICGDDYAPDQPSVQPVLVKLSRKLSFDKVGLQAVQAALTVGKIDVTAGGGVGSLPFTFATNVSFGGVEPRPADVRFGPGELGVAALDKGLEAVGRDGVLLSQFWPSIRRVSGIQHIQAARNYAVVLIGPDPLVIKRGWWNDSTFTLVDSDPTRE